MEIAKTHRLNDYIVIAVIYFISYGLLLFNKGIFWDDWIYFTVDRGHID